MLGSQLLIEHQKLFAYKNVLAATLSGVPQKAGPRALDARNAHISSFYRERQSNINIIIRLTFRR
jgi:hypothetical protein